MVLARTGAARLRCRYRRRFTLMRPARRPGTGSRRQRSPIRRFRWLNIDAKPVKDGAAAREALVRQVDGPVRWVESVRFMVNDLGVDRFVEVGPGAVLCGLIKRISPEVKSLSLAEPESLAALGAFVAA